MLQILLKLFFSLNQGCPSCQIQFSLIFHLLLLQKWIAICPLRTLLSKSASLLSQFSFSPGLFFLLSTFSYSKTGLLQTQKFTDFTTQSFTSCFPYSSLPDETVPITLHTDLTDHLYFLFIQKAYLNSTTISNFLVYFPHLFFWHLVDITLQNH